MFSEHLFLKTPLDGCFCSNLFWLPRDVLQSNSMSKEKMKNVVISLKLFWFELQIKTQGKYHLPFLSASQPSVRCCEFFVIEGLSKFMSFLQKNKTTDWNVVTTHWCKPLSARLHLTFRMFQFSLFVVSVMNFEKLQRFFLCFFSKLQEYYREYWIGLQQLY